MNITELKALAEKATPGEWEVGKCLGNQSRHIYCVNPVNDGEEQWLPLIASTDDAETLVNFEANATYIAAANPAAILELIANLEDAQGEIRALRATEAGLRERVKELEEGLRLCVHTIELANWGEYFTARNARALLEKKE